ncbi:MAG TPA: hypothetical protein VGR28_11065 [Candidatus Thermoplasmatota archaeon]|jgi:plastocyanin|nr:hypothetical protein [Candidatus Thermoplasmatota archaeon]
MPAQPATFTAVPRTATAPAAPARGWSLPRALLVAGFLGVLTAAMLHDPGALASPEAIPFVPSIVATALLVQRETPRRLLAAALALMVMPLLVLFAFGALPELANPAAGTTYLGLMLLLFALVVAAPVGIQGWRRGRRGAALPRARAGARAGAGLFAVLAAAALLGAGTAGVLASAKVATSSAGGYDFAPDATVHAVAKGFSYAGEVRLAAGVVTELVVENQDSAFHTFTYSVGGATYSHDLPGGATGKFLVKIDQPGTVQYWCQPHSGGAAGARTGMVGSLVVA